MKPLSLADALLVEVNHRAANNLQLAASMLRCHARESDLDDVQYELLNAANQLLAMAVVHRHLCDSPGTDDVDLCQYLRTLIAEMHATVPDRLNLSMVFVTEEREVLVAPTLATRLGLIVTELLMNCVKHAGTSSSCRVALTRALGVLTLEISDDGLGLPLKTAPGRNGVGMHLLKSLCSSLDGTLASRPTNKGACFVVTIPVSGNRERAGASADGEKTVPPAPPPPRSAQQRRGADFSRCTPFPAGRGAPVRIKPSEHGKQRRHADTDLYETDYHLLLAHNAAQELPAPSPISGSKKFPPGHAFMNKDWFFLRNIVHFRKRFALGPDAKACATPDLDR